MSRIIRTKKNAIFPQERIEAPSLREKKGMRLGDNEQTKTTSEKAVRVFADAQITGTHSSTSMDSLTRQSSTESLRSLTSRDNVSFDSSFEIFSNEAHRAAEEADSTAMRSAAVDKESIRVMEFKDEGGNVLGTEKSKRADTMQMVQRNNLGKIEKQKEKIKFYNDKLKTVNSRNENLGTSNAKNKEMFEHNIKQEKALLDHLETKQNSIDAAVNSGKTWKAPDASRRCYQRNTVKDETDFPKTAKEDVSAHVNLRRDVHSDADGKILSGVNRGGAIHGYTNGETNLREMQQALKNLKMKVKNGKSLTVQERKDLERMCKTEENFFTEDIEGNSVSDKTEQKKLEILTERLELAVNKRVLELEEQFLEDLEFHMINLKEEDPEEYQKIVSGEKGVDISRVSLVDSEKKRKNFKGGFVLNEKNQLEDMRAIYTLMNGKEITFGGESGTYVDGDTIHLGESVVSSSEVSISQGKEPQRLNATLFNVSTQVDTESVVLQAEINENNLEKLYEMSEKAETKLKKLLEDGKIDQKTYAEKKNKLMKKHVSVENRLQLDIAKTKEKQLKKEIQSLRKKRAIEKIRKVPSEKLREELRKKTIELEDYQLKIQELARSGVKSVGSPEALATDLIDILQSYGSLVSTNCFSGKDRTGCVVALMNRFHLRETLKNHRDDDGNSLDSDEKKRLMNKFNMQLIDPEEGILCSVIEECVEHTAIKVTNSDIFDSKEQLGMNWVTVGKAMTSRKPHSSRRFYTL